MVLQVDGAPRGRRRQVDLVLLQGLLVLSHPVAEDIRVVRGNYCYFWNKIIDTFKNFLHVIYSVVGILSWLG